MRNSATGGYTLLEMMIVVALLAAAAAIIVPSDSSTRHETLALASSQVADALRFARDEAKRTSVIHGVSADVSAGQVRVFRLDEAPTPNVPVFDVYQPVSKQIYAIQLGDSPYRGVALTSVGGQLIGTCDEPSNIAFDRTGVVRCIDPISTRIDGASIELSMGSLLQTVTVDSYTGRVAIP